MTKLSSTSHFKSETRCLGMLKLLVFFLQERHKCHSCKICNIGTSRYSFRMSRYEIRISTQTNSPLEGSKAKRAFKTRGWRGVGLVRGWKKNSVKFPAKIRPISRENNDTHDTNTHTHTHTQWRLAVRRLSKITRIRFLVSSGSHCALGWLSRFRRSAPRGTPQMGRGW